MKFVNFTVIIKKLIHVYFFTSKHAAESHDTIIIKTPDTDVFLLCIAMSWTIGKNLFVMAGTGNRFRIIDTSAISDAYAVACLDSCLFRFIDVFNCIYTQLEEVQNIKTSMISYILLGCNSTSAFRGKGKAKPWKILQENPNFAKSFCDLGK